MGLNVKEALPILSKDKKLSKILPGIQLRKVDKDGLVYEDLIKSIVSQQLSVKAAETIFSRFLTHFQGVPAPEILRKEEPLTLRTIGFSTQKAKYVINVANFFFKEKPLKNMWKEMPDDEIITYLTQIKGVGRWTVQMILMFTLHRSDVFPVDDLAIQQSMVKLYNLKGEKKTLKLKMEKIAAKWSPHRTIACLYLWDWKDK